MLCMFEPIYYKLRVDISNAYHMFWFNPVLYGDNHLFSVVFFPPVHCDCWVENTDLRRTIFNTVFFKWCIQGSWKAETCQIWLLSISCAARKQTRNTCMREMDILYILILMPDSRNNSSAPLNSLVLLLLML